jgi:hypothetical protein
MEGALDPGRKAFDERDDLLLDKKRERLHLILSPYLALKRDSISSKVTQ